MEKIIHRRLIRNSESLFQFLNELGFKELTPLGNGLSQIRKWKKDKKYVYSSYKLGLVLLVDIPIPKKGKDPKVTYLDDLLVVYRGLSIHDEHLKFFAQRGSNKY